MTERSRRSIDSLTVFLASIMGVVHLWGCSKADEAINRRAMTINMGDDLLKSHDPHDKTPPDPPSNLSAPSIGPYAARLQWSAAMDGSLPDRIRNYRIYRNDQPVAEIGGQSLSYEDSGLAPNTEYSFTVSSIDLGTNESPKTQPIKVKTKAIDGQSLYAAFCENCHGDLANSSKKDRSAENILEAMITIPAMGALNDKLTPEHINMIAQALSSKSQSLPDQTPPAQFEVLATGPKTAVMTWAPKLARNGGYEIAGYQIYRDGQKKATLGKSDLSYSDEALEPGESYTFQVSAIFAGNLESLKTPGNTITTPKIVDSDTPPIPPKNLTGKILSATSLEISWQQDPSPTPLAGYYIVVNGALVASVLPTISRAVLYNLMSQTLQEISLYSFSAAGQISTPLGPLSLTTPAADGSFLFSTHCASCHTPASKENRSGTDIQAAIQNVISMSSLSNLGMDDISAISKFLMKIADNVPPTTPTQLAVSNVAPRSLTLSWTASTDSGGAGLKGYRILRNDVLLIQIDAQHTSYVDGVLTPDTSYNYKVIAVDFMNNESLASNIVTVRTPRLNNSTDKEKPSTPRKLESPTIKPKQIVLTWEPSTDKGGSGIGAYKIYRDENLVATTNAATTTWTDTMLVPETFYTYRIICLDTAGNESPPTPEIKVKTTALPSGAQLYNDHCAGCHQSLAQSTKKNRTLAQINTAIGTIPTMASLSSLIDAERRLIAEALFVPPPPPGTSAFTYRVPLGTRLFVESRLARVFQLPSAPNPQIAALFEEISLRPHLFGGPCNHYDKACPSKLTPSILTGEASMMPEVSISRVGYRYRTCGSLTSTDIALANGLQNAGLSPSSLINDGALEKIYGLFYPGKIPNSDVKNALTTLFTQAKSLPSANQNLNGWRMVFYSLCTSPEFDSF